MPTSETTRCACPSTDAQECVEMRYNVTPDEAREEPCECACHETDEEDDNGYGPCCESCDDAY